MDEQQTTQQPEEMTKQKSSSASDEITGIDNDKLIAALSYLGVLVFVPLIIKKDDSFTNFHIKQGLVILAGFVISWLLSFIPPIMMLLWLAMVLASIAGFVQTLRGKRWKIPGIGELAEKFSI